eukprot:gene15-25_t
MELRIRGLDNLRKNLIPVLEQYPLRTQKKHDFSTFKTILEMMAEKKHLEEQGLEEIKYYLNEVEFSVKMRNNSS